jgi:MFS family permease
LATSEGGRTAGRSGGSLSFVLMVFYLLSTLTLALMAVVTPELQQSFGLSASQLGLLTSVFMFAYGAVGIPAGVGAARWGGRVLAMSTAFFVIGSVVFALSSSFSGFLVGRVLQGLGAGTVMPVCSPVIARCLPLEARNRGWGVLASGKGLGALVGLLLMPSIAALGGYRAVFWATAAIALVIGVMALSQKAVRQLPVVTRDAASLRAVGGSLGRVALSREVLLLGLFNAASLAVGTGVLIWTPDFLQGEYGSSAGVAAYLTAGLAMAQLMGAPGGAFASDRWGRMRVIAGSMIAMSVFTVLVPLVPGRVLVFITVALVGLSSLAYFSPRFAMVPEVVARSGDIGPATGLINTLGFTISMLAPWLFGLALDVGLGYVVAYVILAAFGAAGVLGVLFFRAPEGQRH